MKYREKRRLIILLIISFITVTILITKIGLLEKQQQSLQIRLSDIENIINHEQ